MALPFCLKSPIITCMMGALDCQRSRRSSRFAVCVTVLTIITLFGAYLRFAGLGARSLWLDEFCTWHVSQLSLAESLRWEPELTIPPLYQLVLRAVTDGPRPPEWQLRLPAVVCGVLVILAGYWLGAVGATRTVGCALAALLACSLSQMEYSQEARSYTMLVLGCTLSITLWYQLVVHGRRRYFYLYIITTVITFHAHYLTSLTILAQAGWWFLVWLRRPRDERSLRPVAALVATGILCAPIIIRSIHFRSSVTQAIQWIDSPTWYNTFVTLQKLTFGWPWVLGLLAPSIVLCLLASRVRRLSPRFARQRKVCAGPDDPCSLLLLWLICAWFGLLVISWMVQPVVVTRYALPAAVPALLFPLIIAHRIARQAPVIIAALFVVGTAPDWVSYGRVADPGFRELRNYLAQDVDPEAEAVVLTIDNVTYPNWADMERLAFEYYPLGDRPVYELPVSADGVPKEDSILYDPRTLHLIVFRADPLPLIKVAGRTVRDIWHEGVSYSQRLFEPYRVIEVAPMRVYE